MEKFPGIPTTDWLVFNIELAHEALALLAEEEHAGRLLGATQTWHTNIQRIRSPRARQEREEYIAALRARMGEQAFAAAFSQGQAMTLEQATEYAKGLFSCEQERVSFAYLSPE
jgi:hypothetical protein